MTRSFLNRSMKITALISCGLPFFITNTVQAAEPFSFMTNWYAQAEHGGFYQAQADGLYEQAGLDVTIGMGGPQVNPVQLLAAGRAQCVITDDELGTMISISRGIPVQVVATTFQHTPTVLIAHDDIADIHELKDRTLLISASARTSWWPWAEKTLGFSDDQTRPYTFNVQPFVASNQVAQQGYLTSEPFALTEAGAKFKVFPLGEAGYPPYGNAIACRSDVIEQHPEQVAAFLHASMLGWKHYLSDPTKGNQLIQADNPNMSQAQLDYALERLESSGLLTGGDAASGGIGVITAARIEATWKMATELGLIEADSVPLTSAYTTRFIEQDPVLP